MTRPLDDAVAVAADDAAFGAFVAEYAVRLDRGEAPRGGLRSRARRQRLGTLA